MNLEQLRCIRSVAEEKSFTRAAHSLCLTQPAVSAQIRGLERELDAKLFDRVGKRVEITEAGRVALSAATDVLRRLEDLEQELGDLEGLKKGRLSLGASLVVGIYLLPETMGRFKRAHPGFELKLNIEYAWQIVQQVLAGELELGLIGEGDPILDDRLVVEPLARDELLLVVNPRHPWAGRAVVPVADLAREPFIISEKGSATKAIILRCLAESGTSLDVVMEFGNVEAVKRAVEANLGISIVSRCAIAREVADGRLTAKRIEGLTLERNLSSIRRRGKRVSSSARAFRNFFAEDLAARGMDYPPAALGP